MKKTGQILMALFLLLVVFSCKKDKNEIEKEITLGKKIISARWDIKTNEYNSIEFNESGNYVVVKKLAHEAGRLANVENVVFGEYDIIDNKKIVLSKFGTVSVKISDDGNAIDISVRLDGSDDETHLKGSKHAEMKSTTKTDLLCRTWEVFSYDGEIVAGTEKEGASILLSKAGTYIVSSPEIEAAEAEARAKFSQWKWKDETEKQLLYRVYDSIKAEWTKWYEVEISVTASELKITETTDGETHTIIAKVKIK